MPLDWSPLKDLFTQKDKFLLTTHVRPDADGLGSKLALAEVLERAGKTVQMVIASNWPPRYDFLDPERQIQRYQHPGENLKDSEVIIILDTGTWGQLGDFAQFVKESPVPKVVIDHHVSQDDIGAIQLVDISAEATGRLVFEAIEALALPLPESAANMLFAALAMDTGWFRHSNTSAATFSLGEKLMQAGANPTNLYEHLFEQQSLARMLLTGLVLARMQTKLDGKVAYTELHRQDYKTTGALPQDSEDLINYPRSLAGVEVAVMFMEQPEGGIKVSFRSRSLVDVSQIAEQFGGGGHRRASGTIIHDSMESVQAKVIQAVSLALNKGS